MPGRRKVADQNTTHLETFAELIERLGPPGETGRRRRAAHRPAAQKSSGTTAGTMLDTATLSQLAARRTARIRAVQVITASIATAAIVLAMIYVGAPDRSGTQETPQTQRIPPTRVVPVPAPAPTPTPAVPTTTPSAPPRPQTTAAAPRTLPPAPAAAPEQPRTRRAPTESAARPDLTDLLTTLRCGRGRDGLPKVPGSSDRQRCEDRDED